MKALFIAAGPLSWASSRYRAWWTAEALREAGFDALCEQYREVIATPEMYQGYDFYIWQKSMEPVAVDVFGGIHFWDCCDPAWWFDPGYCRSVMAVVDGAICSNPALTNDLKEWCNEEGFNRPIDTIPDRFKMEHITRQKEHQDTSPVRLLWFGLAVNRVALYGGLVNLERLAANGYPIELTVCDDRPDIPFNATNSFPVYNTRWTLESEVEVITNHDIALLPKYPGAWGKVKSSNKSDLANLCGLPAWDGLDYETGRIFVTDYEARMGPEKEAWPELDIKESAVDWLRVFEEAGR